MHQSQIDPAGLLRLAQILRLIPVSKSTWWAGVKTKRFPQPIKLTARTTCWRAGEVLALIDSLSSDSGASMARKRPAKTGKVQP
jgi:predicted DNA-binding transcriptional regulator AlpA